MRDGERLGKVTEWHDARGYGFIQPVDGPKLFFHIRDYQQQGRRPEVGEWLRYTQGQRRDGQPAAKRVRRVVPPSASARQRAAATAPQAWHGGWPGWCILVAYGLVLAWLAWSHRVPDWCVIGVLAMSGVTWTAYALDKRAAGTNAWRTPEQTLHLLELLGGWPGALIAQRSLRHKNRKRSYQIAFWSLVAMHCAVLALLVYWRPWA
ncbi:DUF1294 domain-containing protein [Pseudoxanthomonas winnipegensis]|uniref:DUF1294 domain-containing protein n=1 Tax=Pseudoxanthomonas winnipegensis TaxID=2480810 RepID=A0A4V2HFN0_9GAMM|nr:DUF1294 domain-containing protein [Pseudoxanthomonas winnipegensis]RZZ86657.1 DUF1294 domain-containing protein [Pseudoxanthomonas winnipegensis]TAA38171.1 DUF1294 domain-containing protein [Pseudoxanthomonas winnipegensis]